MKVTLNWLARYVALDDTADALAERLTMLGLEVEGVQKLGGQFEGVVVAQVLRRDPHPNADKLSVCRVQDGRGERQIVCGASNFQAGDKVPLILPGHALPAQPGQPAVVIKVGKIRGVESHGMLCSSAELGLGQEGSGLLILPSDAIVGQPLAAHLGRPTGDVVFDLEITPNRPDLVSVLGIARELAAATGRPLQLPTLPPPPTPEAAAAAERVVAVRIDDPELCPRYTARLVRGIQVGPSPDWLRVALESVGLRSINNVVDVTNYVMLETGQPLHAFDCQRLTPDPDGRPAIVVRRARPGEPFVTLDGQSRSLTAEMLVIADAVRPVAVAGVMGGQNSEIGDPTVDVLIESAAFHAGSVRRTSRALGLRTDASYRFERGVDLGLTEWASRRCAQLIVQTAGGQVIEGVVDRFPRPAQPRQVTLRHGRVNALLGLQLRPEEIEYYLGQLGLRIAGRKARPVDSPADPAEPVTFQIPSWRLDLKREADLVEEVARLYGVDRIPATPPRGALGTNAFDSVHDELGGVRRVLAGLGLNEAQGQTLLAEAAARPIAGDDLLLLDNPLSSDMNALRPSLLPGMLDSLRHNARRDHDSVALFELGRVFARRGTTCAEGWRVALALTGRRHPLFWSGPDRDARYDLYDLKGLLEEFLDQIGLRGVTWQKQTDPHALFLESAAVALGGKVVLGHLGQLQPALARAHDLRDPVMLAELDLDQVLARRTAGRGFKPLPAFPSIRRDLALVVPEAVTHDAVLQAVRAAKPAHLERTELFDVFRGPTISAAHKSVAYAFTYRHPERTLTDDEVNATHDHLVAHLRQTLGASVRA